MGNNNSSYGYCNQINDGYRSQGGYSRQQVENALYSKKALRASPNLEKAISRLFGQTDNKGRRKDLPKGAKVVRTTVRRGTQNDLVPFQGSSVPIGSDYAHNSHGNMPHLQQSHSYGPQYQPHQPSPSVLNRQQSAPVRRRVDLNINNDDDLLAMCNYCNDGILPDFFQDHLDQCVHNPKNKKARCEFCGEYFKLSKIRAHKNNCDSKIENIKITCRHCNEEIPINEDNYHEKTCVFNPVNMVPSQPRKPLMEKSQAQAQSQMQSLSISKSQSQFRSQANQAEECTICLMEMKKNSKDISFLPCTHKFHKGCIEDWSKKQKKCPVCLTDFN